MLFTVIITVINLHTTQIGGGPMIDTHSVGLFKTADQCMFARRNILTAWPGYTNPASFHIDADCVPVERATKEGVIK
jgi:hypothetical protein